MTKLILKLNGDINIKNDLGLTPLSYAVLKQANDIAIFLVQNGADVNSQDNQGKTAYVHARYNNNSEILSKNILPPMRYSLDNDPTWKQLLQNISQEKNKPKEKSDKKAKKGKGKGKKKKK